MEKKKDILSMYNNIDDMISSVDINEEDIIKEDDSIIYINDEEQSNSTDLNDKTIEINPEEIKKEITNEFLESTTISKANNNETDLVDENQTEINSSEKESKKKSKATKIWVAIFAILDFIALVCLFLMYGPISYFRNLWVTSAMTTMSHQYLAYVFFSGNQIQEIMANNTIIEVESETETDSIFISNEDPGVYSSIYEEQILKRDPGNDVYKVIDIEGTGYKGHMLVVYDPSRIDLIQAPNLPYGGKQLETLVEINDALAGINASGFLYSEATGYIPSDVVIMNNELIWGTEDKVAEWGGIIGFNNDNVLVLTKSTGKEALEMGIRDAVSFGPFLIVNGEPSKFTGNGGYGIAPRTAIGQRKDGIVLLLVIDGRRPGHSLGIDMVELTNILLKYGAYNASNLDGGGSSSMVVDGEVLSVAGGYGYSGERYLPNAWIVK